MHGSRCKYKGRVTWEDFTWDMYDQRQNKIAKIMDDKGLDALLIHSSLTNTEDLQYVCNYQGVDEAFGVLLSKPTDSRHYRMNLIHSARDPRFIVNMLLKTAFFQSIKASRNYPLDCRIVLEDAKLLEGKIGIVGRNRLTVDAEEGFKRELPKAQLVDASDLISSLRVIKDDQEIEAMERSASLADMAYKTLRSEVRAGAIECEIVAAMERIVRYNGADNYAVMVAEGEEEMRPATERQLRMGDVFRVLFSVQRGGYWAEIGRTVVVGKATKEQDDSLGLASQLYYKALEKVKPGIRVPEVANALETSIQESGHKEFSEVDYATVHGIGLGIMEDPILQHDDVKELKAGMVIVIHFGLKGSGIRAFLSDTIVVTDKGYRQLTRT